MDAKDLEIAALKAQLESRSDKPSAADGDSRGGVPAWLIVLAVVVFGAIVLVAWGQAEGDRLNDQPLSERIAESCEREYGARGEAAVNDCRIRLSIEAVNQAEGERVRRARQGV